MKKVIIAVVVLLLLCCCCSIIGAVLLFTSPSGYIEFNGRCYHKGAQSNPMTGPCMNAPVDGQMPPAPTPVPNPTTPTSGTTTTYNGKNSDEYTFTYPKSFVLDESGSISYVYSQDPKSVSTGKFNDNLNVTSANYALEITQSSCSDYADQLLAEVGTSLDINQTSVATDVQTINGLKVCVVSWEGQISGVDFTQQQYVFSDARADKNFIVTVSLAQDSRNVGAFADIVDSFKTK